MKKTLLLAVVLLFSFTQAISQTQPTLSDILENVLSSVVTVSVERTEDTKQLLGFRGSEAETAYEKILDLSNSKGSGSGFIIEKNGKKYVITNAHVIENASELAGSIYIYSINRKKYEAKVVGGDSFYDIAVLEFITPPGTEVSTVYFSAKNPRIGEKVFALGNPLGEYPYSVSDGIISAKNRIRSGLTGKFGFLQSTATVIWGNSGGPLVNEKGQVVGINSQIAFADMNGQSIWQPQINFALEGVISKRIIENIISNNGRVVRAYIGIELSQKYQYNKYSTVTKDGWELSDSLPVISGVIPGSPAEKVLKDKIGYKIIDINGVVVRNNEEALGEFEKLTPGSIVKLKLKNGSNLQTIDITAMELNPQRLQEISFYAMEKNGIKLSAKDGGVYISFNEYEPYAEEKNSGGLKGATRLRGQEINFGTWKIEAAGYDSENYKSMWRVKTAADLGAALRMSSSLGTVDLYLTQPEGYKDDVKVKRLSFSGNNQNLWKVLLWY
ncbi:MAG: S1C family serine protease [Bacteroidales bacterium]|jgi:S1-C subfamily serine protease|nr:S1C family serine protease [Bacteroidales bacterium]